MRGRYGHFLLWVVVPFICVEWLPASYGCLALIWGSYCVYTGIKGSKTRWGYPLFLTGLVVLAVGAVEFYLWSPKSARGRYEPRGYKSVYADPHADLGYAPRASASVRVARYHAEEKLYETTYSVGANGLRVAPARERPKGKAGILCFGCSYMWGEGLADEEALPYVLEAELGTDYRAYNFGFHGYGPHQMLSRLENDLVVPVLTEAPTLAVFWTVPDHALRVAGKHTWDRRGPRYLLEPDGRVRREGTFADLRTRSWWQRKSRMLLRKSSIYRRLDSGLVIEPADVELLAGIVAASRDEITRCWPACRFLVIHWDWDVALSEPLTEQLRRRGVEVVLASKLLPGYREDVVAYQVHKNDPHPNAKAARLLAEFLAHEVAASK